MVPNLPNTMTHPASPIPRCWETRSIVSVEQLQKASKNLFSTTRLVVPVYYILLLEFLQ